MTFNSVSDPSRGCRSTFTRTRDGLNACGRRRNQHAKFGDLGAQPFAADIDFGFAIVQRLDDPFQPECADQDAIANRWRPLRIRSRGRLGGCRRWRAKTISNGLDRRAGFRARCSCIARGDQARRHASFRFRRQRIGSGFQRVHDVVDLATGVAQPFFDALVQFAPERLLAILQVLLALLKFRGFVSQRLALARRQAPFVLERLHVAFDFRQVFR